MILEFIGLDGPIDGLQDSLAIVPVSISYRFDAKVCVHDNLQVIWLKVRPIAPKGSAAVCNDRGTRRSNFAFDIVRQFWKLVHVAVRLEMRERETNRKNGLDDSGKPTTRKNYTLPSFVIRTNRSSW